MPGNGLTGKPIDERADRAQKQHALISMGAYTGWKTIPTDQFTNDKQELIKDTGLRQVQTLRKRGKRQQPFFSRK